MPVDRAAFKPDFRKMILAEMRENGSYQNPGVPSCFPPPSLIAGARPITEKPDVQVLVNKWLSIPASTKERKVVQATPVVSAPARVVSVPGMNPVVTPAVTSVSNTSVLPVSVAVSTVVPSDARAVISAPVCTTPGSETMWSRKRDAAEAELQVLNERMKRVQAEHREAKQRIVDIRDQRFREAQQTIQDLRANMGSTSSQPRKVGDLKNLDLSRSWVLISTTDGGVELKAASREIRQLASLLPSAKDSEDL